MASPAEMLALLSDPALRDAVEGALWMTADGIRSEKPKTVNHERRTDFARAIFLTPERFQLPVMRAVIAQFPTLTATQISKLPVDAVKDAVAAVVDLFAGGTP